MGSTWGQTGVNVGSTLCQPGVNLGSNWGQPGVNRHHPPYLEDFLDQDQRFHVLVADYQFDGDTRRRQSD